MNNIRLNNDSMVNNPMVNNQMANNSMVNDPMINNLVTNNLNQNVIRNRKKYNINNQIGILDPNGNKENPLTGLPYVNLNKYKDLANGTVEKPGWRYWPVYEKKDEILKTMKANNIIIAKSGTGSGKTVLLPKLMMHALGYSKPVICTVPKKILAESHAKYASACLGVNVGEHVGYYVKGKRRMNENGIQTQLIFTTIGSLKSRLTGDDPNASEYGAIIVDEAHERSIATDFTFLLLKTLVQRRSDIKILIMSATLDEIKFRDYYSIPKVKVGIVNVGEQTKFHIDDVYEDKEVSQKDLEKKIITTVIHILNTSDDGAILVFVRSGGEGNKLCNLLQQECKKLDFHPFCTELSSKSSSNTHQLSGVSKENYAVELNLWKNHPNQNRNHPFDRKIVMSTNVAESSLTVEDAVYVIDIGKELTDRYNPDTMSRSLKDEWISQSAATQRRGRVGRIKEGVCYHLYTKKQFASFEGFPTPDIQKSDLSTEILDLMKLKDVKTIGDLNNKLDELMEPPHKTFRMSALNILESLGGITNSENYGFLTPLGRCISEFRAIEPIHARALISSYNYFCKNDVIDIISMLQLSDSRMDMVFDEPRDRHLLSEFEKKKKQFTSEYGDFFTLLKIYRLYQKEKANIQNGGENNVIMNDVRMNDVRMNDVKMNDVKMNDVKMNDVRNVRVNNISKDAEEALYNNDGNLIVKNNTYKRSVKKWCEENFLKYRLLKKISSRSKETNRILTKIMREYKLQLNKYESNQNLELLSKELEAEMEVDEAYIIRRNGKGYLELSTTMKKEVHSNILRALLDGFKIHICKKVGSKFVTCFPLKLTTSSINRTSTLKNPGTYIIYNELFEQNGIKINMSNKLTEQILRDPNLKYIFDFCTQKVSVINKLKQLEKKPSKKHKKKQKKKPTGKKKKPTGKKKKPTDKKKKHSDKKKKP